MKERRFSKDVNGTIEVRAAAADGTSKDIIAGYAAMYGVETDMGWYYEEIRAGAFDGRENDDVIAAINHDDDMICARTTAKTLELRVDEKGLWYSFEVPKLSYAQDLAENIRLRNITQSSFMFSVEAEEWAYDYKDGKSKRTITKVKRLYDVSPVVWPAYETEELEVDSRSQYMKPAPPKPIDNSVKIEQEKRERALVLLRIK
jgi:HK97 family phage prohead protease